MFAPSPYPAEASIMSQDRNRHRLAAAASRWAAVVGVIWVVFGLMSVSTRAADPEGCLICHRYGGLATMDPDTDRVRLFAVDPDYYDHALGPHVRLRCTDCHYRDEVAVVPHKEMSPVDCTQACHITNPEQQEFQFRHQTISNMLEGSVHTQEALIKSNELLGDPLRPGQSTCLLCHDEPTFRQHGQFWAQYEAPTERCNVCHDEAVLVDTRYFYWHVEARSHSARSNQDMVRLCAVCHSDKRIQEQFELPDSIASYLVSFHGKATLLGIQETANCLDCHVGHLQNVHMVQSHSEAGSPTSPEGLKDTCRTPLCHPSAGAQLSTAAVHLDLATSRGVEYIVACIFILLILSTFGPSVLLTALKMFHIVVGRRDPDDHHREQTAAKIMADPRGRKLLERFNLHQRFQHWILAIAFITLVLTGFPMKFSDHAWAAWLINLFGELAWGRWFQSVSGFSWARWLHRISGVVLIGAMFYHCIYIARTYFIKKRTRGKGWIASVFDLPMMITLTDLKQMGQLMAYLLFLRRKRPSFGRFNLEEKFEYIGVFWGTILLGITGALMWANAWTTQYFPGRLLTLATLVHSMEAFLALLHVGVVHMVSVIFAPGVFPISPAMFTGRTPTEEIAEAHSAMIGDAEKAMDSSKAEEMSHV